MRRSADLFRLLPLAAAALASVATSPMSTVVQVEAASPSLDESAVAADAVLTVRARMQDGDAPEGLQLRTRTHFDIAGRSERRTDADGALVYTFTPDAPLGADDFVLAFDGTDVEVGYEDAALAALHGAYAADGDYGEIVRFTTVSRPAVRYIARPDGSTFVVSFSEAMDEGSLAAVQVIDMTGTIVPATATWSAEAHSLTLYVAMNFAAYQVRFDEGIVAATGVPLPGLPFTMAAPLL